jgi:hypothetical protein
VSRYLEQFQNPVFRVRDWHRVYEKSDAQRTKPDPDGHDKPLPWVAIPTKHDGAGYKRLMRESAREKPRWDSMRIHSAFILIVQVAAKMPERGLLRAHDGQPIGPAEMSDKTDGCASVFSESFEVLSNPEFGIKWIEVSEDTSEYPRIESLTRQDKTLQDTTGQDTTTPQPPPGERVRAVTAETHPPKSPSPKRDPGTDFTPGFLRFWATYPSCERKTGKSNAARSWKRRKLDALTEQVIDALERCKASRQWAKNGGEFIPGPGKWLSDAPWESDPADLIPAFAGNGNGHALPELDSYPAPSAAARADLADVEDEIRRKKGDTNP